MVTYFQIIGAVITYKRLSRNPTNIFILNLAVADLGVAAITNPVHIASKVVKGDIQRFFWDLFILCLLITFVLGTCLSKTKPKYTHRLKRYKIVFE